MNIEISVDELVLRGVADADAAAVSEAIRARLTELATSPGSLGDLDASTSTYRPRPVPGATPAQLGTNAADAVWDAVTGSAR